MKRLYADGKCVNLQVSVPDTLRDALIALANSHQVSIGVFLTPHLRRVVEHEHLPHDQVHLSPIDIEEHG